MALCVLALGSSSACGGPRSGTAGASSRAASASAPPTPRPTPAYPFAVGPVDAKSVSGRIQAALKTVKTYRTVGEMKLTSEKAPSSPMLVTFIGEVDQSDPVAPRTHVTMSVMGKSMELVSVGPKVWIKDNGAWVEGGSQQADQVDQTQVLTKWGDAVKSAEYVGEDATGHHFTVTVDPKKMVSTLDADAAAKIGPVPANYWLDDEFRPVKVTMKIAEGGSSISSTTTVSRLNQPVTIPSVA